MSTPTYVPVTPQPGPFTRMRNGAGSFVARYEKPTTVNIPSGAPRFLGNRNTLVYSWLTSMAIISWDEWHHNHILPRPSRLWYATWFYLMLILLSMVDIMVPIANALAIGYTIMLGWQYFQGTGGMGGNA